MGVLMRLLRVMAMVVIALGAASAEPPVADARQARFRPPTLVVTADRTEFSVDEPVTLTLTLTGHGEVAIPVTLSSYASVQIAKITRDGKAVKALRYFPSLPWSSPSMIQDAEAVSLTPGQSVTLQYPSTPTIDGQAFFAEQIVGDHYVLARSYDLTPGAYEVQLIYRYRIAQSAQPQSIQGKRIRVKSNVVTFSVR